MIKETYPLRHIMTDVCIAFYNYNARYVFEFFGMMIGRLRGIRLS